ncbi:MAG: hypothetical protein WA635_03230 [Gallionella sp.]
MNIKGIMIKSGVIMLSLFGASLLAGCSTLSNRGTRVAASCDDRGPITFAEYKMLKGGQTLEEANAIFGCIGLRRQGIVGEGPFTIEWAGGAGGSTTVTAIFINGRVDNEGIEKYGF